MCALALDGFLCVCRARCRRKYVLLSESEARYTSTASVDYVSGFCHNLTRKQQVLREFNAPSSDSIPALDRTEEGHQCGLIGGCLLQNASLGLSLQGHQTGLLGLVPGQLTGKRVLGKVFSRVLPDQVWRACGFPK